MPANDNRPTFDLDALGRIYLLGPNGERKVLVEQFNTWSNAARRMAELNGRDVA